MLDAQDQQQLYSASKLIQSASLLMQARVACKVMLNNHILYWNVERSTGVPWLVVAALHFRESSQSFKCHLHNGDPLSAKTVHIPSGRPVNGAPPFTWGQSAVDALMDREQPDEWDMGGALWFCEDYNGPGYQKHGLSSPYIWSGTDQYRGGLFTFDGHLDPMKCDPRPGVAALFKTLELQGVPLDFNIKSVQADNRSVH